MRHALFFLCSLVLIACADRTAAPVLPEAEVSGIQKTVFVGTTRAVNANGEFGIGRNPEVQYLRAEVTIPSDRDLGKISNGGGKPKPGRDFILTDQHLFRSAPEFSSAISKSMTRQPSASKDATIYVHGFNNSYSDATFRIAQLTHDLEIPGASISYAWPSRGNPLGYEYDADSALFARDGLVELLISVQASGVDRIILVGHSMGGAVVMETLRQLELTQPGWVAANLGGVLLISPDVNVDVFRSQVSHFTKWPQPFAVFSSQRDIFLRLSARLRGEDRRLGNLSEITEIAEFPVTFIDVTEFGERSAGHFVAGSSGAFIQLLRAASDLDLAFLAGQSRGGARKFGADELIERFGSSRRPATLR